MLLLGENSAPKGGDCRAAENAPRRPEGGGHLVLLQEGQGALVQDSVQYLLLKETSQPSRPKKKKRNNRLCLAPRACPPSPSRRRRRRRRRSRAWRTSPLPPLPWAPTRPRREQTMTSSIPTTYQQRRLSPPDRDLARCPRGARRTGLRARLRREGRGGATRGRGRRARAAAKRRPRRRRWCIINSSVGARECTVSRNSSTVVQSNRGRTK